MSLGFFMTHTEAWWPTIVVLMIAVVIDIRSRRIPNWLSLPFLVTGMAVSALRGGSAAFAQSLAGIGLALVVAGALCYLRGMGMGDLKLFAAVGAWIGPGQLFVALIATGIAGGFLAAGYALCHRSLGKSLDSTGELLAGFGKTGFRPHATIALDNVQALKMPYAPAIAIGTMFSFFAR
jgi:prepilin peptidase CpaA